MDTSKYNPGAIRKAFQFLVDEYGYTIRRDEELFHNEQPYAFVIEFVGNGRRVSLSHDYRDNFFDFNIIKGLDTQHPNDEDNENISPFIKVFMAFERSLNPQDFQPYNKTCAEAASINAYFLKKYASKILFGEDWV